MTSYADLAIETVNLTKTFGDTRAVDGIDLVVNSGSIYGVLGPNGAGKTTLIRMLATLLRPSSGTARVLSHDLKRDPHAIRERISLTGQFGSVDEDLTGIETLLLLGRFLGLGRRAARTRAGDLLEAFGLTDAAKRQVKTYSGGMKRRIDIAASMIVTPETPLSGRADNRTRPSQPQSSLGDGASDRRKWHNRSADHAVPRRG